MNYISIKTALASLVFVLLPMLVLAQAGGAFPNQRGFQTNVTAFSNTVTGQDLLGGIRLVVNGFLVFISMIAIIMLVVGGLKYITSAGDEDAAAAAKNTILYAVIGLIVIGFSAVVVNFTIRTFSV
jgi:hypothetical protein